MGAVPSRNRASGPSGAPLRVFLVFLRDFLLDLLGSLRAFSFPNPSPKRRAESLVLVLSKASNMVVPRSRGAVLIGARLALSIASCFLRALPLTLAQQTACVLL